MKIKKRENNLRFLKVKTYRYDNGTYTYWIGSAEGNINSVFGTAFRSDAVVTSVSWYLTSEFGIVFPDVKIWVFGLDSLGQPDMELLLHSQDNVPNTMDQWNVFNLDQGIVAPDGFLVGISYGGFFTLGCDDGLDPEWPFNPQTMYYAEYGTSNFSPIESFLPTWSLNFMLRAYGIEGEEIDIAAAELIKGGEPGQHSFMTGQAQLRSTPSNPCNTPGFKNTHRGFSGFNIYLNDLANPIAFIEETQYLLSNLAGGQYLAGVQSVYTSGLSDIITVEFTISQTVVPGDANCDSIVNVMDIIDIANYIMGANPEPFCFDNADVNGDGIINVFDIIATVEIILGGGCAL